MAWVPPPCWYSASAWTPRAPTPYQSVVGEQKQGTAKPLVRLPDTFEKPARPGEWKEQSCYTRNAVRPSHSTSVWQQTQDRGPCSSPPQPPRLVQGPWAPILPTQAQSQMVNEQTFPGIPTGMCLSTCDRSHLWNNTAIPPSTPHLLHHSLWGTPVCQALRLQQRI